MLSLLLVFFAVAILFSFLCSTWEAVLLSVTPAYAQLQFKEGTRTGRHLQAFKQDIDRPLAAILTLNTIAHTVGAIGVGTQAAQMFADANPLITSLLIPALMTLAILVLSEIIPKTLGATYWRELAPFTVQSLLWIIRLLAPLVWLSERITRLLKKDGGGSILSRRDFLALTELGADQGALADEESKIIRNLLKFRRLRARDAMTPRTVMHCADARQSIADFHNSAPALRFSRIPLHHGDPDNIDGFVLRSELQAALLDQRGDEPVGKLRRDLMVFLDKSPIGTVFEKLLSAGEHIALVVDEYGDVAGLITIEDVIETLLGLEITDETDTAPDMQQLAREHWEKRARALGLLPADVE